MKIRDKFGIISSVRWMELNWMEFFRKKKEKTVCDTCFISSLPSVETGEGEGSSCQRSVHLSNYRSLGASQLGSTMSIKREIRYNCSTFARFMRCGAAHIFTIPFLIPMAVCFTHEML